MKEREGDITGGDHSRTMVLRVEFGRYWRAWSWVRRQFSAVSITTLAAMLLGAGGYILNLKTRVVVLETQVVPVIKDEGRVDELAATVRGHGERISRLETNWDDAQQQAGTPPVVGRKRK